MSIAWLNKEASVDFTHVHQLIAYMEKHHHERIERYALQIAMGSAALDAWVACFSDIVTIYKGSTHVPLLLQEMGYTVQHIVLAHERAMDIHEGVGIFLHGTPVWTLKDSEAALQGMLDKPMKKSLRAQVESELTTVQAQITANGHASPH